MPEYQTPGPSAERPISHELLSEDRLGDLLAAVGNHEGKALLLVGMDQATQTDVYYSPKPLHGIMENLPGARTAYLGNVGNQATWCERSLEPTGLVSRQGAGRYFAISQEGRAEGVPLAGLLLDFSYRHEVPLAEVFGSSVSTGEVKSPLVRMRMMQELLTSPKGVSLNDLVEATGISSQVIAEKHLRKLAVAGLVEYSDWDNATNETTFSLVADKTIAGSKAKWFTQIETILRQNGTISLDEMAGLCRQLDPGQAEGLTDKQIKRDLSQALFRLKRAGVVKTEVGRTHNQTVQASLTHEQEEMWADLLNLLESFRGQDSATLTNGRQLAREIASDGNKVSLLLNRAMEASPLAQTETKRDLGALVINIVQGSTSPLTVRELVKRVSEQQGRTYSHWGIARAVRELADSGALKETKNKVLTYSERKTT